jgi:hypothetical protein
VGDIGDWGLVTTKRPIGIGTTFQYTVTKLTKPMERLERTAVPVEGWLHFCLDGVRENKIEDIVYRLNVLTATGAVSADIRRRQELNRGRRCGVSENSFYIFCYWLYCLLERDGKSLASKSASTSGRFPAKGR